MTDKQIVKALEDKVRRNPDGFYHIILDFINRQKAEIERLCMELDEVIIAKDLLFDESEALIKKTKIEAIKEFSERLKDMSEHFWEEKENFVSEDDIDNLVKEMVGEG